MSKKKSRQLLALTIVVIIFFVYLSLSLQRIDIISVPQQGLSFKFDANGKLNEIVGTSTGSTERSYFIFNDSTIYLGEEAEKVRQLLGQDTLLQSYFTDSGGELCFDGIRLLFLDDKLTQFNIFSSTFKVNDIVYVGQKKNELKQIFVSKYYEWKMIKPNKRNWIFFVFKMLIFSMLISLVCESMRLEKKFYMVIGVLTVFLWGVMVLVMLMERRLSINGLAQYVNPAMSARDFFESVYLAILSYVIYRKPEVKRVLILLFLYPLLLRWVMVYFCGVEFSIRIKYYFGTIFWLTGMIGMIWFGKMLSRNSDETHLDLS